MSIEIRGRVKNLKENAYAYIDKRTGQPKEFKVKRFILNLRPNINDDNKGYAIPFYCFHRNKIYDLLTEGVQIVTSFYYPTSYSGKDSKGEGHNKFECRLLSAVLREDLKEEAKELVKEVDKQIAEEEKQEEESDRVDLTGLDEFKSEGYKND